ncbi:uncharacterized protein LOC100835706 [Brachypodium distachyon]|uniref:uncharacterized protein LOC100835706 n=1 Tax=Brachypodium distachyon TaxID=15368 RepID=UPI000D0D61E3|nr:uncharacterized protein LOC100835706 [Brachypodium distachyon]|eukprot:XP_024314527.1 uncharacterized protein LOC100835706 [Brachypodium distachyon]
MLHDTEVIWDPFSQDDIVNVGGDVGLSVQCTYDSGIWMTRCKLVFAHMVEPYEPERVMRQFGLFQEVPPPPPRGISHDVHTQTNQGKNRHNWRLANQTWIQAWSDALTDIVDEARGYDPRTYEEYLEWYVQSTRVRLTQGPPQGPTELTHQQQQESGMDRAIASRRDDTVDKANSIMLDAHDIIKENPPIHHRLKTKLKNIMDNAKDIVANWSCGRADDVNLRAYHMPEVRSARPSEARSSRPSDVETGGRVDSTLLRTSSRTPIQRSMSGASRLQNVTPIQRSRSGASRLQNVQYGLQTTWEESPPQGTTGGTMAGSSYNAQFTAAGGTMAGSSYDHGHGYEAHFTTHGEEDWGWRTGETHNKSISRYRSNYSKGTPMAHSHRRRYDNFD